MEKDARPGILFVEHAKLLAGGQVSCLNMARIMIDAGRRTTLLYPRGGSMEAVARARLGDEAEHAAGPDIEFTDRRKTPLDMLKLVWMTLSALRFLPLFARHDVIYVSSARWFVQAFFLSHFIKRRFVYHIRVDNSALEKRIITMIANSKRTHLVLANTEFVRDKLLEAHPELANSPRFGMLRTPIFPPFNALAFEDRFEDMAEDAPLVVALVGRLTPTKGQDIVLDIAPRLPRCRFVIIGGGTEAFADYARKLKDEAPANVVFHGESTNVVQTLHEVGAHVSLVPSRWDDPFPLVATESISCSCIAMVRRRGGLGDLADLIGLDSFNTDEEAEGILARLQDTPRAELAAEARRQHADLQLHYSFDAFADHLRQICFDAPAAAKAG